VVLALLCRWERHCSTGKAMEMLLVISWGVNMAICHLDVTLLYLQNVRVGLFQL
jgi:hypothetical protein